MQRSPASSSCSCCAASRACLRRSRKACCRRSGTTRPDSSSVVRSSSSTASWVAKTTPAPRSTSSPRTSSATSRSTMNGCSACACSPTRDERLRDSDRARDPVRPLAPVRGAERRERQDEITLGDTSRKPRKRGARGWPAGTKANDISSEPSPTSAWARVPGSHAHNGTTLACCSREAGPATASGPRGSKAEPRPSRWSRWRRSAWLAPS